MENSNRQNVLGNNKGFTLIEMAIVLVIIGVIIGAVVKGQDLVENAKAKQFAGKVQSWQISLNTYYDRKGKFPGANTSGIISSDPTSSISAASFVSAPEANFTIGGAAFAVYLGNDASNRNYLYVGKSTPAKYDGATDSNDLVSLKFFESYDTAIDGSADPSKGSVLGFTSATNKSGSFIEGKTTTAATDWLASSDIWLLAVQLK